MAVSVHDSVRGNKRCTKEATQSYLLFEDGRIVAAGAALGNELDHVSVRKEYAGRGYGKEL